MIYLVTNTINGKRYIGKTAVSIKKRWYQHCKNAEYGKDTHLYKAIRKYGKEAFTVEFLADGLDDEEIKMIETHQPEYNMTKGGDGGDMSHSPNFRRAMLLRDNSGSNNPMYGKKGKDNPNFGKKRTPEQIANMKKAVRKKIAVVIHGERYDSVAEAAKTLGRSERYIRLHDELNEWNY